MQLHEFFETPVAHGVRFNAQRGQFFQGQRVQDLSFVPQLTMQQPKIGNILESFQAIE